MTMDPKEPGFDPETGEVSDQEGAESEAEGDDLLAQIVEASSASFQRGAPLAYDEIQRITAERPGMPAGVLGWFAKLGTATVGKGDKAKTIPGARIKGQIVGTMSSRGKFGVQQAIVIFGRYQCRQHLNRSRQAVPAVDKVGRWLVGIDSTLTELPAHVGQLVDIEVKKAALPGSGQRHVYERVDLW